jgi:hydroxymethylglutaryl-CoA reductase (NADPH)
VEIQAAQIGTADENNCEQMFGAVPVPIGFAGPLHVRFSSDETHDVYLPLATTEGALVASINRGCKVVRESGVQTSSEYLGISRTIALEAHTGLEEDIRTHDEKWKKIGEATSNHLKILSYDIDTEEDILFLTIAADTDEAMGMNMLTIAAQEIGSYLSKELGAKILTVAGNVDSDKKPSARTKTRGRGISVKAQCTVPEEIIRTVLRTDSSSLLKTAHAKLELGSKIAGAISSNLHAANIISAMYIATGQDSAHVVEGSLADTKVEKTSDGIQISVELPALLLGVRGGGTELPAQKQCLSLIMKNKTALRPTMQLAEVIGAAVVAGELSLLAAQTTNTLAKAHKTLGRSR